MGEVGCIVDAEESVRAWRASGLRAPPAKAPELRGVLGSSKGLPRVFTSGEAGDMTRPGGEMGLLMGGDRGAGRVAYGFAIICVESRGMSGGMKGGCTSVRRMTRGAVSARRID